MRQYRMEPKDFEYLDKLPQLVLAVRATFYQGKYADYLFKPGREFVRIAHQTAGYLCNQHYLHATILKPRPEVLNRMYELEKEWLDSCVGTWGVPLDVVLRYRASVVDKFGLDCNRTYCRFEEGIYPLDLSPDYKTALAKVSDESFPDDLDDLIQFESDMDRHVGSVGRWGLYVLGENCD